MKKLFALFPLIFLFAAAPATRAADYIAVGSQVTFVASADGSPAPTFEWYKDGVPVTTSSDGNIVVSNDTASLVILKFDQPNTGTYTVKATNPAGSATSQPLATLIAIPPSTPTIKLTAKKPGDVTVSVPKGTKVVVQP